MIPHPENLSRTPMDLQHATQHFRLLADPTRLRLLLLLNQEELSVAELSGITQLAQPRVSTHLARLKEAGLVSDRRDGVFVYYRIASAIADPGLEELWRLLRQNTDDPLIQQDLERIAQILTSRAGGGTWADSVAGDMERHYSPGRTWEATARGLVHLDSRGSSNLIATPQGRPSVIDFQAALSTAWLPAPLRRRLEAIDTTGSGDLQRDRGLSSPLREDERRPCIAREEILGAAPERRGAFFGVPSVIEAGDS